MLGGLRTASDGSDGKMLAKCGRTSDDTSKRKNVVAYDDVKAVSYTHLDVYKRQDVYFT